MCVCWLLAFPRPPPPPTLRSYQGPGSAPINQILTAPVRVLVSGKAERNLSAPLLNTRDARFVPRRRVLLPQLPNLSALGLLPLQGPLPVPSGTSGLINSRIIELALLLPVLPLASAAPRNPNSVSAAAAPAWRIPSLQLSCLPRGFCAAVAGGRWDSGDLSPVLLENCKPGVSDLFLHGQGGTAWERVENFRVGGKRVLLRGKGGPKQLPMF